MKTCLQQLYRQDHKAAATLCLQAVILAMKNSCANVTTSKVNVPNSNAKGIKFHC